LAVFFTDFEIIGTGNAGQGSVQGELRRRTTVTEWRPERLKLGVRGRTPKPRPFKPERVGHPKKPNQSHGVEVLEWRVAKPLRRF
jgi:hypothetical protein